MLPSLLLLPIFALTFTSASHLRNKNTEMTEQAAISANMLREQTLLKRSPQAPPPPPPGQPAPQSDPLGFVSKPNMIIPQFVPFLLSPQPPAAAQDERKRKRSLRKRHERVRPKVYHQKSNSLGGTSLVYDGENVQRSSKNEMANS